MPRKRLSLVGGGLAVVAVLAAAFLQFYVGQQRGPQHALAVEEVQEVVVAGSRLRFQRHAPNAGVMEIWGKDDLAYARALGWAHAQDRLVQMVLQRLLTTGRLSECLASDETTRRIDTFFRELGFGRDGKEGEQRIREAAKSSPEVARMLEFLEAYVAGINAYIEKEAAAGFFEKRFEFLLTGYTPEPWRIEHSLGMLKLMAYMGLAESQGNMEAFVIQALQGGVPLERLQQLFPQNLDNIDDTLLEAIKRVRVLQPFVPPEVRFSPAIPSIKASNNWVVGGQLSASGKPMQCNDPHLEISRLPAVWYEILFHYLDEPEQYWTGITVPGIPAVIMGRNKDVSYGLTYGFMDQIDFFLEEIKDGKYKRVSKDGKVEWLDFVPRVEVLKQKDGKHEDITLVFYENDNGVLELDKHELGPNNSTALAVEDGIYLMRKWSWAEMAPSDIQAFVPPPKVSTAKEAQEALKHTALSANFLIADSQGNIAYQQSGFLPNRAPSHSGFHPVIAWTPGFEHSWKGRVHPDELHSIYNPDTHFIATANNNMQRPRHNNASIPLSINLHMGPYRAARITDLLSDKTKQQTKFTIEDMKAYQVDRFSKEAQQFMKLLRPVLPEQSVSAAADLLREWDLTYSAESKGPIVYSLVWQALMEDVFGRSFGADVWRFLSDHTFSLLEFHWYFDRILLGAEDAFLKEDAGEGINSKLFEEEWFGKEGRKETFRRVATRVLSEIDAIGLENVETYATNHSMLMVNILFNGKLPVASLLGIDVKDVPVEGCHATLLQGAMFKDKGRSITFGPSWRYVADLATSTVWSALPSGPSDRPYSGLYTNPSFFEHHYKPTICQP
ncbi:Penicillin amidase [Balamuthia mandrillaris]